MSKRMSLLRKIMDLAQKKTQEIPPEIDRDEEIDYYTNIIWDEPTPSVDREREKLWEELESEARRRLGALYSPQVIDKALYSWPGWHKNVAWLACADLELVRRFVEGHIIKSMISGEEEDDDEAHSDRV